jgi:hypothetical protein
MADTLTDREALRAKFSSIKPAPTRARPGILARMLLRLLRR